MTIPATASEIEYAGNGVTTAFPIPFVFDTSADIKVIETTTATGAAVVVTTGFSITGGGGSTGTCTYSVAPAVGKNITLIDDPAITQTADYTANDGFPAEAHEGALDRGARISKRLAQRLNKTLRFADGDISSDFGEFPSPAARKGLYFHFNDTTGEFELSASITGVALSQSIVAQVLYPQSAQELAAGITPSSLIHDYGDPRRSSSYKTANWVNFGHQPTYISNTSFSVPTDVTADYPAQCRVRVLGDAGAFCNARVTTVVFGAVTTFTVTCDTGNVPNPARMLFRGVGQNADDPGVSRWDLNNGATGVFAWNVNMGASAVSRFSVFVGISGAGADNGCNWVATPSTRVTEYLTGSGVTGRQIAIHTGVASPILIGVADQTRMIFTVSGTPIKVMGSAEAFALVSTREGDSLGGIVESWYRSAAQGGARKGFFGFPNGGSNNTLELVNEETTSNIKIAATGNVWLAPTGGLVYLDAAANVYYKYRATGSPEGSDTANVGSIVTRGDNANSLYIKQTGSGNTGWVLK